MERQDYSDAEIQNGLLDTSYRTNLLPEYRSTIDGTALGLSAISAPVFAGVNGQGIIDGSVWRDLESLSRCRYTN